METMDRKMLKPITCFAINVMDESSSLKTLRHCRGIIAVVKRDKGFAIP